MTIILRHYDRVPGQLSQDMGDMQGEKVGNHCSKASQSPSLSNRVELQRDPKWKTNIDNITSESNKTLGLVKRNLNKCS